jgi:hypothetical protein
LLIITFVFLIIMPSPSSGAGPVEIAPSHRYAINLLSSLPPVEPDRLPAHRLFDSYHLYMTRGKEAGVMWHRLRLGFFPNKAAAEKAMGKLRGTYPEAWVTIVSKSERANYKRIVTGPAKSGLRKAIKDLLKPLTSAVAPAVAPAPKALTSAPRAAKAREGEVKLSTEEKRLEGIMEEAEKKMAGGDYSGARRLYLKVLKVKAPNRFAHGDGVLREFFPVLLP